MSKVGIGIYRLLKWHSFRVPKKKGKKRKEVKARKKKSFRHKES